MLLFGCGWAFALLLSTTVVYAQYGTYVDPSVLDACPGYAAQNVQMQPNGLTADLVLAGTPCEVFGPDIKQLKLQVAYETGLFYCLTLRSVLTRSLSRYSYTSQDH